MLLYYYYYRVTIVTIGYYRKYRGLRTLVLGLISSEWVGRPDIAGFLHKQRIAPETPVRSVTKPKPLPHKF